MRSLPSAIRRLLPGTSRCEDVPAPEGPFQEVDESRDDVGEPFTDEKLRKIPKTSAVLVAPEVLTRFIAEAIQGAPNEVGGLALGRTRGRFLVIDDLVMKTEPGTSTRVEFTPEDWTRADEACKDDQAIVAWFHSHPGYGVFLSGVDKRHQRQGQGLDPDFVALVVDPIKTGRVEFGFYRVRDDEEIEIPYRFYAGKNAEETA